MLEFSFSSVYMAVISTNLLIIILTFCFRNKKIMINAGYRLLWVFAVLTVVRLLLPFEFPFTKTLHIPEIISKFIVWIRHPFIYIGSFDVDCWKILLLVWVSGIIVFFIRYIRLQNISRYRILANQMEVTTDKHYQILLNRVCSEMKHQNHFRIFEVEGLTIPHLFGVFAPCILLPSGHSYSDEQLYYIMMHEASHHFRHDLLIKQIVNVINILYWWNPFCRTLVSQTNIILEMRIDDAVTNTNPEKIKEYLHCLIELAESKITSITLSDSNSISLLPENEEVLVERFEMLIASSHKKKHLLNLILLFSVISLFLLSHLFILETPYYTDEVKESTIAITQENTYAIMKEDGTYDVYGFGLLLENTESLDYYPGIQIYTEKEYENAKK